MSENLAELLIEIQSRSSYYSKVQLRELFRKLIYFIKPLDDLNPIETGRYTSRSASAERLKHILNTLEAHRTGRISDDEVRHILLRILELTIDSLDMLTNKKIEYLLSVYIVYFADNSIQCEFILEKLKACYGLA